MEYLALFDIMDEIPCLLPATLGPAATNNMNVPRHHNPLVFLFSLSFISFNIFF
jgi:hypothetical protein